MSVKTRVWPNAYGGFLDLRGVKSLLGRTVPAERAKRYTWRLNATNARKHGMSGKVWSGAGAILVTIFGVVFEKNWGTFTIALTAASDFLSSAVVVPMYFMILAAFVCVGALVFLGFYVRQQLRGREVDNSNINDGRISFAVGKVAGGAITESSMQVPPAIPKPKKRIFSEEEHKVLSEFAKAGAVSFPMVTLKGRVGASDIQVAYAVNKLVEKNLVKSLNNVIYGSTIMLTEEGSKFIVECGKTNAHGDWVFVE